MTSLKLIPLLEEHIEIVRGWRNDPEVSKYMFSNEFISAEQQSEWFKKAIADPCQMHWIIVCKNDLIGMVSLTDINLKLKQCYWGFYIGNLKYRGEGLGRKSLYQLLVKAFDELKLHKIQGLVLSGNEKSIKLHEYLGFRRESYFREHVLKNQDYQDVVGLGLLNWEWENTKDALYKIIYKTELS